MRKSVMKVKSLLLIGAIAASSIFTSCDSNKGGGKKEPNADATPAVVPATKYESWSYINLEDAKQKELEIQKKDGAVTGLYTGTASYSLMGMTGSQEDLTLVISQLNEDSVKIEITGLNISMSGDESLVDIQSSSMAVNDGSKWVLTSDEATSNLVDPDGDGTSTDYKLRVSGEVGLTKGSDVKLNLAITPGAMPMEIPYTYSSTVENSFVYEVDGEKDFSWDLAFHKYDVRTNGAAVAMVEAATLEAVTAIPAESEFVEDVESSVISDLSNMMSGSVGFHYTTTNKALYNWVTRTSTGSMPPVLYELNNNVVFVVRTNQGDYYKIKFTDHTSDKGEATYATFSYLKMEN